jgi:predicted phosphohydrolase
MIGLNGQAVSHGGAIFAGARSAPVPSDDEADSGVRARFALALSGLENALASAARLRDRDQPLFVLWHDPPHGRHGASSPVTEQLDHAGATACVFGHVHAESQWATRAPSGSVRYLCVAADALGFHPIRLFG